MGLRTIVPPTLRTYGLDVGKVGFNGDDVSHSSFVRPGAPASPDDANRVIPSKDNFKNSVLVL